MFIFRAKFISKSRKSTPMKGTEIDTLIKHGDPYFAQILPCTRLVSCFSVKTTRSLLNRYENSNVRYCGTWRRWLFSPLARIFGEYSTIHSPPALFSFKVESSSHTLIPRFRPGSVHSGSASWHDCGRVFPNKLRVSSLPDRYPHYGLDNGIVSSLRLCWDKVCVFRCNLPPACLAEWSGSFTCHCGTQGWNGSIKYVAMIK